MRRPPLDGVLAIARALRVPVAQLLAGADDGAPPPAEEPEREPFLDHLFHRIARLPRPQQELLRVVAEGLWKVTAPAPASDDARPEPAVAGD